MTDLTKLSADLEAAKADVALLERLNSASRRVTELTKACEAALKERERAEAKAKADTEAERQARLDGISDIRVSSSEHSTGLMRNFRISFRGMAWDRVAMTNTMQTVTVPGFALLARDFPLVMQALIERYPEKIPADIAELAPGDPNKAFAEYFAAKQRGFVQKRAQ